MPRRKNSPNTRGEPSITPDRAIQLLWETIEKGRHLETLSPLHTGDFENWDNTTRISWKGRSEKTIGMSTTSLSRGANHVFSSERQPIIGSPQRRVALKFRLSSIIEQLKMKSSESLSGLPETAASSSKVFIVHGHNKAIKYELAHSLQNAGVDVTILDEQTNEGRTILEKLADHATQAGFAVVLLSADDVGRAKSETGESSSKTECCFRTGTFWDFLVESVFVLYVKRESRCHLTDMVLSKSNMILVGRGSIL